MEGFSPKFPSNSGTTEGNFAGIGGHLGSWNMDSFVRFFKSGKKAMLDMEDGVD